MGRRRKERKQRREKKRLIREVKGDKEKQLVNGGANRRKSRPVIIISGKEYKKNLKIIIDVLLFHPYIFFILC